ncbi:MAG: DnaJ domain-containing protein [Clostridia bacterium]
MEKDPYKTLGVHMNAADEDVKRAYKDLVRKYHPDRYADNPLKDLADEKLREINSAYDQVMNMRKTGGSTETQSAYGHRHNPQYEYRRDVYGRGYDSTSSDICKICQCLICTDCCCECMGGDFLACC